MICSVTMAGLTGCPQPVTPDPARCEVAVDRPTGAVADGADQVQVRVTVRDSAGQPVPGVQVELAATGTGNALLQPAAPTDGSGVAIGTLATTVAESKTISASISQGAIPSTATAVFSAVVSGQLAFVREPTTVELYSRLPPVTVAILDSSGNLTSSTAMVTVSLSDNPSGAILQGTTTVTAVNGIAAFMDLSVDHFGSYRLSASSATLGGAQSASFTITSPSTDVTGTSITHHILEDGSVLDRPQDLSNSVVAAYILESAGSYTIINGTGTSAGTFRIPNVPAGARYFLRHQDSFLGNNFFETTARTVDLGRYQFGRPDVASASAGTVHHNSFSGMKPWTLDGNSGEADWLEMTSANANLSFTQLDTYSNPAVSIGAGETQFNATTDYGLLAQRGLQPLLVDASRGDRTYLTQLTLRDAGPWVDGNGTVIQQNTYRAVDSACGPLTATVADGQSSTLTGTFSTVAQQSLPLSWLIKESTAASFGGFRAAVSPVASTTDHTFGLFALPSGVHDFAGARAPRLLQMVLPDLASSPQRDQQLTLRYGNPFPAGWTAVADASTVFRVPVTVPRVGGGNTTANVTARLVATDRLSAFPTTPLRPQISPITNALIEGTDFQSSQTLVNTTPLVHWNAPAIGVPTYYAVVLRKLSAGPTGGATQQVVARLVTRANLLWVPPGILEAGSHYVVQIRAVIKGAYSVETAPHGGGFPVHSAEAVSGLLSVP